jgi:Carboxypeptidase regulatory-like domain
MRRTGHVATAVAAALLLTSGVARVAGAQKAGGSIGGEIMDRHGKPLVSAHIDLLDSVTGTESSVLTDANGNYVVNGLAVDHDYAMTVRCIGFLPQRRRSVAPTAKGSLTEDVTLDPISDSHRTVVGDARRGGTGQ